MSSGSIPDYQMAAWRWPIYLRGMTVVETAALTEAMLGSAQRARVAERVRRASISIRPAASATRPRCCSRRSWPAADLQVPMISGRGLGATGGTLDKLEAIPGFRTDLSPDEIQRQLSNASAASSPARPPISFRPIASSTPCAM